MGAEVRRARLSTSRVSWPSMAAAPRARPCMRSPRHSAQPAAAPLDVVPVATPGGLCALRGKAARRASRRGQHEAGIVDRRALYSGARAQTDWADLSVTIYMLMRRLLGKKKS